jgi:hypothetical protein
MQMPAPCLLSTCCQQLTACLPCLRACCVLASAPCRLAPQQAAGSGGGSVQQGSVQGEPALSSKAAGISKAPSPAKAGAQLASLSLSLHCSAAWIPNCPSLQVIPASWLRLFSPREVNQLLGGGEGGGVLDVDDMQSHTHYR